MIQLNKVIPIYFDEDKYRSSEIWNQNISFPSNHLIEVVAPSGSGKTSLIHFLYGMRKNFKGDIQVLDFSLSKAKVDQVASLRRDHLSIVFQDLRLFPQLTIEENIQLQNNVAPYLNMDEIKSLLSELGVIQKWNQLASLCSYGEQQRVAIVRALSKPFDYLLLDEPFSHLDEENSLKALNLLVREVKKRNATMILADLNKNPNYPPDIIYHL